jgi:molybdate transport system substrate-binding protein
MKRLFGLGIMTIELCVCSALRPGAGWAAEATEINVYVAGSLAEALQAVLRQYQRDPASKIKLIAGLSADFAKQIESGAPANIFISSSTPIVDGLVARGHVDRNAVASPIGNGLLLIAPANSPLTEVTISPNTDFLSMLGPQGTLATGDPDYVTLGVYALQALSKLGKWSALQSRLARATDVQAALELVESGRAPLGITFSTAAAASKKVKVLGRFPSNTFTPIRYTFAIVKARDGPETRKLFNFMTGPIALRVYSGYGFDVAADDSQHFKHLLISPKR